MNVSEVLSRARGNDVSAQRQLVDRFYPAVSKIVHRELETDLRRGKPWIAQLFSTGDVVHDVFLRVLHGVDSFDGDESDFERYLSKAVTHRLLDVVRYHEAARRDRRRIGRDVNADGLPNDDTSPSAAAVRLEESAIVKEAMNALTTKDQALLELRMRKGAPYEQIAKELGLPSADAARKATSLAEARLLLALRSRGVDGTTRNG
mgnify:CR=1 FL=1